MGARTRSARGKANTSLSVKKAAPSRRGAQALKVPAKTSAAADKKGKAKDVLQNADASICTAEEKGKGNGKGKGKSKGKGKVKAIEQTVVLEAETATLGANNDVEALQAQLTKLQAQLKDVVECINTHACDECFQSLSCNAPDGVDIVRVVQQQQTCDTKKPKQGTLPTMTLHQAVTARDHIMIESICRSGVVDVNARDSAFMTPLDCARDAHSARILVEIGKCDPNLTDNHHGCTAFARGCYAGLWDVARYLATVPAVEVNKLDLTGKSALDCAIMAHEEFGEPQSYSLINFLKSKGARTGSDVLMNPEESSVPESREYLNVRYEDKDEAKMYGAKWDAEKRCWWIGKRARNHKVLVEMFGKKKVF